MMNLENSLSRQFGQPDGPAWIEAGLRYLGLEEIPGPEHSKDILGFWEKLGLPFADDETSWCAAYAGASLEEAEIESTRSGLAKSYETFGVPLHWPAFGALVVLDRGVKDSWQGHVGFLVGRDAKGRPMLLSGNSKNRVGIDPFDPDRITAMRWPSVKPYPERYALPLLESSGKLSTDEA